jgi:hypothetical protein
METQALKSPSTARGLPSCRGLLPPTLSGRERGLLPQGRASSTRPHRFNLRIVLWGIESGRCGQRSGEAPASIEVICLTKSSPHLQIGSYPPQNTRMEPNAVTSPVSTFSGASRSFMRFDLRNRQNHRRSVGVEYSRLLPVSLKERLALSRRKPRATLKKGPGKAHKTSTPCEGISTKPPALGRPCLSRNPRSSGLVRWSALLCLPSIL